LVVGGDDFGEEVEGDGVVGVVVDGGFDGEVGEVGGALVAVGDGGDDVGAVGGDVQGGHGVVIDVLIDATAFIPPGFALGGVDSDDEGVGGAVFDVGGDVEVEGGVAAFVVSEVAAIEPEVAVAEDGAEFELDGFAGVGLGDVEVLAIPADFGVEVTAAFGGGLFVGDVEAVVVGEVDGFPVGVVVSGGGGGFRIADCGLAEEEGEATPLGLGVLLSLPRVALADSDNPGL